MAINDLIQKFPKRLPKDDKEWAHFLQQVIGVISQHLTKDGALTDEMPIDSRGETVKAIVGNLDGNGNAKDTLKIASRDQELKNIIQRLNEDGHAEDSFQIASRATAVKDIVSKIANNGRAQDVTFLSQRSLNFVGQITTGNPLTATDNATIDATIDIAAFTYRLPGIADINYNSGQITGLAHATKYYVYGSGDANFEGDSLTYTATTNYSELNNNQDYLFIDTITTPASGGGSTSGGGSVGGGKYEP